MRIILIHGKDTDPTGKWYPWFIQEMQKKAIEISAPVLPDPNNPRLDEWINEIDNLSPDSNTILIGHSRGGMAALRWLEGLKESTKVKKVILVATNSGFINKRPFVEETNYGFYTEKGYDFNKIKTHCDDFVVFHSEDDEWVPYSNGEENAKGLGAKFISFTDKGHFGRKIKGFPELLEEIL